MNPNHRFMRLTLYQNQTTLNVSFFYTFITLVLPTIQNDHVVPRDITSVHSKPLKERMARFLKKEHFEFNSTIQEDAMRRILLRTVDVCCIQPTASGKSSFFMFPPKEENMTVVVVVPLDSLLQDILFKSSSYNLNVVHWNDKCSWADRNDVVLASASEAKSDAFAIYLAAMHQHNCVSRIVFDEVHLYLSETSYRNDLVAPSFIRCIPVPIVCLTATLSPLQEEQLQELFDCHFEFFRIPFDRKNLVYSYERVKNKEELANRIKQECHQIKGKIIVYCNSRESCHMHANEIPLSVVHHSGLTKSQRLDALNSWRSGEHKVIVATCGLSAGIDIPDVSCILHAGLPDTASQYVQETGRAGRNGHEAHCHAFHCHPKHTFFDKRECRRGSLSIILDGKQRTCSDWSEALPCDICQLQFTPQLGRSRNQFLATTDKSQPSPRAAFTSHAALNASLTLLQNTLTSEIKRNDLTPPSLSLSTNPSITIDTSIQASFTNTMVKRKTIQDTSKIVLRLFI